MELAVENLKLRAFKADDAATLVSLCNNKNIWDNVRDYFPHPYALKDAKKFIKTATSKSPLEIFAIEREGGLVGCIGIHPGDDVYRFSAEIGYWIGEPYWGQGIATQAIKLITDYGFNTLRLAKIFAGCFEFNKASQKVLLKAGFDKEAVLKKAVFKNSRFCDEIRYTLLKVPES